MSAWPCLRVTIFSLAAIAASANSSLGVALVPDVCVRNFRSAEFDPCSRAFPRYSYVQTTNRGGEACVMTYDDSLCKSSPVEFDHVRRPDGSVVCTINYHQPPVATNCATSPDLYIWVPAAYRPNP